MERAGKKIFFQLLLVYRKIEKKRERNGRNRAWYLWSGTTIIMDNCGKNQYQTEKNFITDSE